MLGLAGGAIAGIGSVLGDLGGLFGGMSSAEKANRTNILLQKRQQAWEEKMSNTAVARRADDIEAAGGNRALAFTNGQEASTPNVAPATVQPTFNGNTNFTGKAVALQQLQLQKAQTEAQVNQANTAATLNTSLAGKADAEKLNIATATANIGLTGKNLAQENENLQATKREIEARAAETLSRTNLVKLETDIKSKTKNDLISLAASEAAAAKYGVTFKQWQDLLYGALNKMFGSKETAVPFENSTRNSQPGWRKNQPFKRLAPGGTRE